MRSLVIVVSCYETIDNLTLSSDFRASASRVKDVRSNNGSMVIIVWSIFQVILFNCGLDESFAL